MGGGDEQKVRNATRGCPSINFFMQGLEIFTKRQKMGRLATPEEVAALVVYLCSEEVRNCVCRRGSV